MYSYVISFDQTTISLAIRRNVILRQMFAVYNKSIFEEFLHLRFTLTF